MTVRRIQHRMQLDSLDCGPVCLMMIGTAYGLDLQREHLGDRLRQGRQGALLSGICEVAEQMGLHPRPMKMTLAALKEATAAGPVLLHWNENHYVVLDQLSDKRAIIHDPAHPARLSLNLHEFERAWARYLLDDEPAGITVTFSLPTTPGQDVRTPVLRSDTASSIMPLLGVLIGSGARRIQLLVLVSVALLLAFLLPFAARAVFDLGLRQSDVLLIAALMAAQASVSIAIEVVTFLKNSNLIHRGLEVHTRAARRFIDHLLHQPLPFFEARSLGDTLSHLEDHRRLRYFLSSQAVDGVVSVISIAGLCIVLAFLRR